MIRRVGGSDDTLAIDTEDFPTLFFHVFCCHVPTLWVSVTCSYESCVFLTRSGNAAFRNCLQSVCIFLSIDASTFRYYSDMVLYAACFGVSFVLLHFLCVQMIFI